MANLPTREAYGNALQTFGEKYDFVVLDADLAKATQTIKFKNAYPNRFIDMGISEGDMMTTAAGIATCGKTVFASTFAMFAAGRAYEQIRNSICYPNLKVIIGATHGGVLIGEDGASHQCIEDISLMRTIPNMKVVVPCDENSVTKVVEAALNQNGPVYIRTGRMACQDVFDENYTFEFGKGTVIKEGSDLTIIAIGDMVIEAIKASEILESRGVSVAVIDMASIKPIDSELVKTYAEKTGKIITCEDHNVIGGLGSAVAEVVAESGNARVLRVGMQDQFGRSGTKADLQSYYKLNAEEIVATYNKF